MRDAELVEAPRISAIPHTTTRSVSRGLPETFILFHFFSIVKSRGLIYNMQIILLVEDSDSLERGSSLSAGVCSASRMIFFLLFSDSGRTNT